MANTNVAFGLKPINMPGGSPATQGTNAYFIDSGASAIFQGSIVKCDNGGEIVISSATADTEAPLGVFGTRCVQKLYLSCLSPIIQLLSGEGIFHNY